MSLFKDVHLPDVCAIGFKEWAGVCGALGAGRQSILIRKGGIAEEQGLFRPEYPVFWLIPTVTHQAEQGLKPARVPVLVPAPTDGFAVDLLAAVESVHWIDDEKYLPLLDEWHVWTDETVRKRFHYRQPGFWVLSVKIYRRPLPFDVEATPERLGCKTWISLSEAMTTADLTPVLGDDEADPGRMALASLFSDLDESHA